VRDLSANADAERIKTGTAPRLILAIEWGGDTGTRYYSDAPLGTADGSSALNAESRVGSWGTISAAITEATTNPVGDLSIELLDADLALLALINSIEPQRKRATIYQHFVGLEAGDLVPVLRGIINHPVAWSEAEATLTLDLTDVSAYFQTDIGTVADIERFPKINRSDVGKCLPLVYGRCKRVPAVHVACGATTTLWQQMNNTQMHFYGERGDFPEDEEIEVWIDKELLRGSWHGNTFTVTERGIVLVTSCTTAQGNPTNIVDDTLEMTRDQQYQGYHLALHTADGTFAGITQPGQDEVRMIMGSSVEHHSIFYYPPFSDGAGFFWTVPANTPYQIRSVRAWHAAGAIVRESLEDGVVYIANDAPSESVDYVEAWGKVAEALPGLTGASPTLANIDGWVRLDPLLYTVNLNDTTSFPDLGHAVTTVTFLRNPSDIKDSLTDRLVATVRGVEDEGDGSGTAYQNPADVIKAVANGQLGLADDDDLDTDSFDTARARLAYLRMAFAVQQPRDALDLLADLALQCRAQCVWEAGRLTLKVLEYTTPAAVATLSTAEIAGDSMSRQRSSLDDVVTELIATWRPTCVDDDRQVVQRDDDAEALYNRRSDRLDAWAYQNESNVTSVVAFWLHRRARIYEDIVLETMLTSLDLERLDAVELDWPAQFDPGRRAVVMGLDHTPGSGQDGQIDTIRLALRASVGDDACETSEQEPDDVDCGTCETDCQEPAELFCTGFCDAQCTTGCQVVSDAGCGAVEEECETACESGDESECDALEECDWCEFWDESGCDAAEADCIACEGADCIVSCQAGGAEPCHTQTEQGCATCCRTYNCQTACMTCGTEPTDSGDDSGDCGCTITWMEECPTCETGDETGCGLLETGGDSEEAPCCPGRTFTVVITNYTEGECAWQISGISLTDIGYCYSNVSYPSDPAAYISLHNDPGDPNAWSVDYKWPDDLEYCDVPPATLGTIDLVSFDCDSGGTGSSGNFTANVYPD